MSVWVSKTAPLYHANIETSLSFASALSGSLVSRHKLIRFAFLNRACELACVLLHQRYVETSNGAELAWFTYRPEAIPNEPGSWPDAVQLIGYVDDLTETEARSRAIGW